MKAGEAQVVSRRSPSKDSGKAGMRRDVPTRLYDGSAEHEDGGVNPCTSFRGRYATRFKAEERTIIEQENDTRKDILSADEDILI